MNPRSQGDGADNCLMVNLINNNEIDPKPLPIRGPHILKLNSHRRERPSYP